MQDLIFLTKKYIFRLTNKKFLDSFLLLFCYHFLGEKMVIKIEDQQQNFEFKSNNKNTEFDVLDDMFVSTLNSGINYQSKIYSYHDVKLFWCIVLKNLKFFVRFVLFDEKTKFSNIIFEAEVGKDVFVFRLNKQNFLIIQNNSMHIANKNLSCSFNKKLSFEKLKKISLIKQKYLLVHSIENKMQTIQIFDLNLNKQKTLFCTSLDVELSFEIFENKIFVKTQNKKILKTYKIFVKDFLKTA